jgi:hypothetical protein
MSSDDEVSLKNKQWAKAKFSPDPEVVFTNLKNGEAVLLHLGTNQYFSLNETGTLIWELVNNGRDLDETSQEIEAKFDVSLEVAQQSVIDLVEQLVGEKLLVISS